MNSSIKATVSFDYCLRTKLGTLLLVLLMLLSSLQLFSETFVFDSNLTGFENISFYEKRFEGVRELLPRRGVVGYMSGPKPQVLDFDDFESMPRSRPTTVWPSMPFLRSFSSRRPRVRCRTLSSLSSTRPRAWSPFLPMMTMTGNGSRRRALVC